MGIKITITPGSKAAVIYARLMAEKKAFRESVRDGTWDVIPHISTKRDRL